MSKIEKQENEDEKNTILYLINENKIKLDEVNIKLLYEEIEKYKKTNNIIKNTNIYLYMINFILVISNFYLIIYYY